MVRLIPQFFTSFVTIVVMYRVVKYSIGIKCDTSDVSFWLSHKLVGCVYIVFPHKQLPVAKVEVVKHELPV